MGEKQKEYSRLAERHSASLKMSGYRKELNHDAILELKVSLDNARENELRPLKAKLESYRGLPPNPGDLTLLLHFWNGSHAVHVTSFSSISYYSYVRLISKIELEQNFQSIIY